MPAFDRLTARAGFGGIVLAHNVASRDGGRRHRRRAARAARATVTKAPERDVLRRLRRLLHRSRRPRVGGRLHNPGFTLEDDGSLTLPDFDSA